LEAMNFYFQISPLFKLRTFTQSKSSLIHLCQMFKDTCLERTNDVQHRGCMAVNCVSELVHVNEHLGPFMEHAINDNIQCFKALLDYSVHQGELADDTNTLQLALALQNTFIGLNTLSKVVTNEHELWDTVKFVLISLKVYQK